MAIAYDSSGTFLGAQPGTSGTPTFSVGSSADRILWIGITTATSDGSNKCTALTYGGVSLTLLVDRELNTSNQNLALYYLVNPASGSNTLSYTFSESVYSYFTWEVFSGFPVATGVVGTNTASGDAASGTLTLSLTTQGDNAWLVSIARSTDTGSQTPGTGTTERQEYAHSTGDSNGAKTPTGSYSMAWSANPSGKIGGVMGHFYVSAGA